MPDPTLLDALRWHDVSLPAGPAEATTPLRYADVGDGAPRVMITCGIHGDEGPWSALAVRRVLERSPDALRGRLRIVLASNPTAVADDARVSPLDHLDLNRAFPGSPEGTHTERLGAALSELAEGCDVVVDLHGGGSWCVNAFAFRFPGSEDLADAVGAPFVVDMPIRQGNLAGHVAERGSRIVAIEMGGRSNDEMAWRDRLAEGVARVLSRAGALDEHADPPAASTPVTDLRVVRPARGGVLVPTLRQEAIGTVVPKGSLLGVVHDLHTMEPVEELHAPYERTALLLIRPHVSVLEGGAMTYVVGRAH
ncbi:MAG: M14 family metallopeptidase [Trueperaceae bacterium]|nr:M14 family metallopeptidase [Trueperaceae bacterium]